MKVLQHGNKSPIKKPVTYPIQVQCQNCGCVLEVEREDIYQAEYGCPAVDCSECHKPVYVDEADNDFPALTIDTVDFPQHYAMHSISDGAFPRTDDDINKDVKTMLKYLRDYPDPHGDGHLNFYEIEGGDTLIVAVDYPEDESYLVFVAKPYYSTEVPYEDIDYKLHDEAMEEKKNG